MAHAVLNGAPSVASGREASFPEQVLDALDLIDEFITELARVRAVLEPLEALYPGEN
ncbi:hypothetical protein [Cupriavidus sp. 8B]